MSIDATTHPRPTRARQHVPPRCRGCSSFAKLSSFWLNDDDDDDEAAAAAAAKAKARGPSCESSNTNADDDEE